jgi:hypothetical protein
VGVLDSRQVLFLRMQRALLPTLLAGLACQSDPVIGRPPDWPTVQDRSVMEACLRNPEVTAYLVRQRDRMLLRWNLPDVSAGQEVQIGFILRDDGTISRAAVFEASDRTLARSALKALSETSPEPPPPEAGCLVGLPMRGTFSNPLQTETAPDAGPVE